MHNFENKVAVVTGTANPRGIGFAVGRRLAALGCHLVLADIDREGVEARAEELRASGTEALAVPTDMSERLAVEHLASATYDRFGAAHVVLLNHVAPPVDLGHSLLSPEPDAWERHNRVNFLGVTYGIKAFVPRMIAEGEHGHVLATTSGAGATGTLYGNGPYAVSKAAITSLMECLYGQLRDARVDIVASLLFPGLTNTFPSDDVGQRALEISRSYGKPAYLDNPDEVARFTIEAIERDSFWSHPDVADDERLTGGRRRATIEWENAMYRTRAETLVNRAPPDAYLYGPPTSLSSLLEPDTNT